MEQVEQEIPDTEKTDRRMGLAADIAVPCLGFALLRLVVMMYDQGAVYNDDYMMFIVQSLSRGVVPLLLLVFAMGGSVAGKRVVGSVAAAAVVGAACTVLTLGLFPLGRNAVLAAHAVGFSAMGWLYILWAEAYSSMRIRDVALSMMLSMPISTVLGYLVGFLSTGAYTAVAAVSVVAAAGLFVAFRRLGQPFSSRRVMAGSADRGLLNSQDGWFALLFVLYSISFGVVHAVSIVGSGAQGSTGLYPVYAGSSILLALVLTVAAVVRKGLFSLRSSWIAFTAVSGALLALSLVIPQLNEVALSVFAGIRYITVAYLNIKLMDIAHHSKLPACLVFATGWAAFEVLLVFGLCLSITAATAGVVVNDAVATLVVATLVTGAMFAFGGARLSDVRVAPQVEQAQKPEPAPETVTDIRYRQSLALRQKYALTDRETEIVLLISQGYSQPYCADSLMVSLNTVRTHMKHVYSKLDIHTKAELIDRLEEAGGGE